MAGIKNLTVKEFEARINRFDGTYVHDWDSWLKVPPEQQAARFGLVLRKWQACRPNRMRRTRSEQIHEPPYLEDLIAEANHYLRILDNFVLHLSESFSRDKTHALSELWRIFQHLPYQGRALNGLASVTGISIVNEDVQLFEAKNGITLTMAAPKWAQHLNSGRIYDMALGPGD